MSRSRRKPGYKKTTKKPINQPVKKKKKEKQNKRRNNKTNKKQKKTESLENKIVIIGISFVILALSIVVGLGSRSLKEKDKEYREREQALISQIQKEEQRSEQLEHKRIYVQTKQYIEEVAKEKLGLVRPDEIIIKPKKGE